MPKSIRLARRLVMMALAAYWLLLAVSTHIPAQNIGIDLPYDKLLHLSAFAGLSFLLSWCRMGRNPSAWQATLVLAITLTYGALDEYTQSWVSTRSPDARDWIADACGISVGLIAYFASWQFLRWTSRAIVGNWRHEPLPINEAA